MLMKFTYSVEIDLSRIKNNNNNSSGIDLIRRKGASRKILLTHKSEVMRN